MGSRMGSRRRMANRMGSNTGSSREAWALERHWRWVSVVVSSEDGPLAVRWTVADMADMAAAATAATWLLTSACDSVFKDERMPNSRRRHSPELYGTRMGVRCCLCLLESLNFSVIYRFLFLGGDTVANFAGRGWGCSVAV